MGSMPVQDWNRGSGSRGLNRDGPIKHEGNRAVEWMNQGKSPVVMTVAVMSKRGEGQCR